MFRVLAVTVTFVSISPTRGQEAKLPWPAVDSSEPMLGAISTLTTAKTVYVQSDLPPAFATLPTWFLERYKRVDDPTSADLYVFIRAGAGGNTNADLMLTQPNGTRVFSTMAPTPPQPPQSAYDESPIPWMTNWARLKYYIEQQEAIDAKKAKKAAKQAEKKANKAKEPK